MSDVNLPGGQPVLTFYTKEGSDYVSSITQDGQSVSISVFPCGSYASEKHFFASGVDKETITIKQNSDWFTVSRASVFEDASNPDECGFMITVQQNFGFERSGTFIIQGGGMDYTVSVRQEASNDLKVSGMSVFNAICECADGSCDISEYHYSCSRESLQVHATLPERGQEGTTYFIGSHTTGGFEEYVWSDASGWVKMGVAEASLVAPASADKLGLVKVAATVSEGADVGMDGDLRLKVPMAAVDVPGVVKLGSVFHVQNPKPYHVGVTTNNDAQLVFNLRQLQSDGSAGCLRYDNQDGTAPYSMYITEASASQMGIVKLAGSIAGLSDSEVETMRNTHAASVGLVLDGLESFVHGYITDERLSGYFENWAAGKNLADAIWAEHKDEIISAVASNVLAS